MRFGAPGGFEDVSTVNERWNLKVRTVQKVEALGTELHVEQFCDVAVLDQRVINTGKSGAGEDIAPEAVCQSKRRSR